MSLYCTLYINYNIYNKKVYKPKARIIAEVKMKVKINHVEPETAKPDMNRLMIKIAEEQQIIVPPSDNFEYAITATYDGNVVGLAAIFHGDSKHHFNIYVDPEYQGKGIGNQIADETLRFAKESNLENFCATTLKDSISDKMLEKKGMTLTKRFSFWNTLTDYNFLNTNPLTLVSMYCSAFFVISPVPNTSTGNLWSMPS